MFKSNDGTNWGAILGLILVIGVVMTTIGYNVEPQLAIYLFVGVGVINLAIIHVSRTGNSFQGTATVMGAIITSIASGFFIGIGQMLQ